MLLVHNGTAGHARRYPIGVNPPLQYDALSSGFGSLMMNSSRNVTDVGWWRCVVAARLKLGNYETVERDPLGRRHIGYFPQMTETEAWEAGRGVWKMSVEKAGRQRFALIVGEGLV